MNDDNPQIVKIDLHQVVVAPGPRPPLEKIANKAILKFLKENFSPNADWKWDKEKDSYSLFEGDALLIEVQMAMFKNSVLQEHDIVRYNKIIAKRLRKLV